MRARARGIVVTAPRDRDQAILLARAKRLAVALDGERPSGEHLAPDAQPGVAAIVVEVADQSYAFPLTDVRRAAIVRAVTEIPHVPPVVLGIGIIDGNPLAIYDARVWLGRDRRRSLTRMPVLVLGSEREPLALAVDRFAGSLVIPPPRGGQGWLQEVTEQGVLIVRVAALLRDPTFSASAAGGDLV